jgi:peptidoglycan/LPS O-acetylase OafA/YrhL
VAIEEGGSRHLERVHPAFARRLAGIEGLRGVAIASVLLYHVWLISPPRGTPIHLGWLGSHIFPQLGNGVTLFFALSGFLLFLPFATAALRQKRRPEFDAYLKNRALRILPAYWFIFLITALVLHSTRVYRGDAAVVSGMHDPKLLIENLFLLQNYRPSTLATGIVPAWSLVIEVVFYLLLPLLVVAALWLSHRARSHRQRVAAMLFPAAVMAVIGLASLPIDVGVGRVFDRTWVGVWQLSFLTHAHLFALGLALAVVRVEWQDGRLRLPAWWRPVGVVALVALAAAIVKLGADHAIASKWQVTLVAVVCGLLLALTVLPPARSRSRLIGTLESPPFVATGLASYSVYLWHAPIILWLRVHGVTHGGGYGTFALNLLIVGTITGVASWLTYRYVEKPALRLKSRTRVRRPEPAPAEPAEPKAAPGQQRAS